MRTVIFIFSLIFGLSLYGQPDTLIVVKSKSDYWDKTDRSPSGQRRSEDSILSSSQHLLYFDAIDRFVDLTFESGSKAISFPDTFLVKNVSGTAEIICYSMTGKSKITNTYFNGQVHFTGEYSEAFGQLRAYCVKADWDLLRDETTLVIRKYYQPIRQGKWEYFNIDGVKLKDIYYEEGLAVDSTIYQIAISSTFNRRFTINFWQNSLKYQPMEKEKMDSLIRHEVLPYLKRNSTACLVLTSNVSTEEYVKDSLIGVKRCEMVADYLIGTYKISRKRILIDDSNNNSYQKFGFSSSSVSFSYVHRCCQLLSPAACAIIKQLVFKHLRPIEVVRLALGVYGLHGERGCNAQF